MKFGSSVKSVGKVRVIHSIEIELALTHMGVRAAYIYMCVCVCARATVHDKKCHFATGTVPA